MRCLSCDCALTDQEVVRKSPNTGEYLDLCSHCLADINMYEEPLYEEEEVEDECIPLS